MNKNNNNSIPIGMLLFLFIFSLKIVDAQKNLVPNPSFEITPTCNISSNTPPPPPWFSPSSDLYNTSDYSNSCSADSCCTVPYNNYGTTYQPAHSGNAYIGEVVYGYNYTNYRQYAETKLIDSLLKNHFYYVSFFVNLGNRNQYAISNLGLLFTDTAIKSNLKLFPFGLIPAIPQITSGNSYLKDTMNWTKISGVYKAKGGEKFITIGNFNADTNTDTLTVNTGSLSVSTSGYQIDDVSVIDSALLPVLLSSYHIQQFNHQIINTWQTATEVNVSHFNIQRSSSGSGKDFETVGVVMAKGVGKYEWMDDAPLSLGRGAGGEALFYRLETVDKDGERMYSDVRKIIMKKEMSGFSIYPNPTPDGNIHISFENSRGYNKVTISDFYDRKLQEETVLPGINRLNLNLKYQKGVYFVTVTNVKTGIKEMKKIVLQ